VILVGAVPSLMLKTCANPADQQYRTKREDILRLKVRSASGALVPLGTLIEIRNVTGPDLVQLLSRSV
jgi:multidrug efflux pump subunit AcrB